MNSFVSTLNKVRRGLRRAVIDHKRKIGEVSSRSRDQPQGVGFHGDFSSWQDALANSTGYDADIILKRTREATLKVKRGEAAYERDSVILDKIEYPFEILTAVLRAALDDLGKVSVLDFGGALGSSYFQCRGFLGGLSELRWSIVEQPKHVACGRADFQDDHLRFYYSIDECLKSEKPNLVLLSGVLQCLPEPHRTLRELTRKQISYLVIDRTAFIKSNRDRLTVETVPAWIYPARYPSWFLVEETLVAPIRERYDMVADFRGWESDYYHHLEDNAEIYYKGFIFRRKVRFEAA